ncbi:DUF2007 domain-containing protein [Enterovibrio sp. ZSDZ35]|uniref:DUF2007 domain-containing protein n=1 Tax=Enterovibrio qingdaonensis TaxID=2899818 RepID=A0ABT5QNC1_9GAMM|nr:DUF2007 domain-containing protein [Enterovibrio sp. ZSDZ35]MDD1781995.1 DUF2007 domain-containing protein [Enterovibrio sp. ZSDZ35]
MSLVQVYSASNSLEAHSLKGMLETEAIDVVLKGETLSSATGELPADVLAVTLWVDVVQEAVARKVLAHYEAQSNAVWWCSACQEESGGNFEICWQCGVPRAEIE